MKLEIIDPDLRAAQERITRKVNAAGGRALLVGGSVRDALLGRAAKDLDFEIYGLEPEALRSLLGEDFGLDLVGRAFGVLKVRGLPIDVGIPRRESKRGLGHKGFEVHSDPFMTFEDAARRRDFTLNALGYDPRTGEIVDPHGGVRDLEAGVLRHTSEQFVEDPLRVLRAMQLAARFDFRVDDATVALCRAIEPEGLPRERILDEWKKLILLGTRISRGLSFWRDCGWVQYTPELEALIGCEQDREWHPEGDVWVHTSHVMDAYVLERVDDAWEDLIVGLGCLCHDLGKPATSVRDGDRIRSAGHEIAGEGPTRTFLARLTDQEQIATEVVPLVREHMNPYQFHDTGAGPSAIRRLARRVGRIDRLVRVCRADQRGRPPKPFDGFPAGQWLLEQAAALALADQAPRPIVLGRHLIAEGQTPGPAFGPVLEQCFEAQLDGEFDELEGGLIFLRRLLNEA